jgi:hypothetical protein
MGHAKNKFFGFLLVANPVFLGAISSFVERKRESSYSPVIEEPFERVMARDKSQKAVVMQRHMDLLNERYDLS